MNCDAVKGMLRERFDAGTTLSTGLESHLVACGSCRRYCERLAALDGALATLPLEPLRADFGRQVHERLKDHAFRRRKVDRVTTALAAAATVFSSLVAGWYYPVTVDPRQWWNTARTWLPEVHPDWKSTLEAASLQARIAWDRLLEALDSTVSVPLTFLWPTLCGFVLFLLIFNAVEAHRINGTRGGSKS